MLFNCIAILLGILLIVCGLYDISFKPPDDLPDQPPQASASQSQAVPPLPSRSSTNQPPPLPAAPSHVRRTAAPTARAAGPGGLAVEEFPTCPICKCHNELGAPQKVFWNSKLNGYVCIRHHKFKRNGRPFSS